MKLLIEEYQYDMADVAEVLDGLFTLQDVEKKISVSYVGYYYNSHEKVKDVVFILPKVLIDEKDLVFGKYPPKDLINLDEAKIEEHEKTFLYEFAVWIHRAIVVYNDSHRNNSIVLHKQIESEGKGSHKKKSNTLLDVILSLILFNKENQQFFTFILKNIHSGLNKINWGKTISTSTAMVQGDTPVYLNPVNKKKMINFDEELIIIFFSILHYISERFGFRTQIPFGFKLITGNQFERYINGFGRRRLLQIKYKYFSDTAVKLWDLCYAFFDKTYLIKMNVSQNEYLLVKSFYIVFEAMIDELLGTPHSELPPGLAEQYDGKIVDHLYTYEGLLKNSHVDNDIYYIGDSKYYKIGHKLDDKSIYKQRTYARNVIQWNMDIWQNNKERTGNPFEKIKLFDDVTEGYKVIPNFFISADIDKETLSYEDKIVPHPEEFEVSRQLKNRLYDRDTLLLSRYNVNFLFIIALYGRNNSGAKETWKQNVREKFRKEIQEALSQKFDFYALTEHPDVEADKYFKENFKETLGKIFRPYDNKKIYSLALDNHFAEDNKKLLDKLSKNFYVTSITLGEDPSQKLAIKISEKGKVTSPDGKGLFLFGIVNKYKDVKRKVVSIEYSEFQDHKAHKYVMRKLPKHDISKAKYFIPIIDGGFSGYYEIIGFSIGSSKQTQDQDGNSLYDGEGNPIKIDIPHLNIKLGEYHSLGERSSQINKTGNWNGQVHTYTEVKDYYNKS